MVPIVLLTGFLGSGKTSLLNGLLELRKRAGEGHDKLAILVNELGSIGIDGSLFPPGAAKQIELPGGCICCSLDENLERSLVELLDEQPDLAMVVIETTGIAEPLPIVWTLSAPSLSSRVRVAAVVTVVDVLEHERHRPMAPAVDNQVECADLLVVSKLDCLTDAPDETLAALTKRLRLANPHAPIVAEANGLAGATALWQLLVDPSLETERRGSPAAHSHDIESVVVPIGGVLDFEELTAQLEDLPPNYIRIKGTCRAVDGSTGSDLVRSIAFHRVGARVSWAPLAGAPAVQPCLVALGRGLEPERLAACVEAAVLISKT